MRKLIGGIVVAWLLIGPASQAKADIIASYTVDTAATVADAYLGQSFTTTTLVPETDLTFNFPKGSVSGGYTYTGGNFY